MQEFINFAVQLAEVSGTIIKTYARVGFNVETKGDGSPVTIADRQAEEAMRELIMRHFPEHGIIGEEFGKHQPDAEYQWTLDPIDGTQNFVAGSFLFGTLISLLHNGKPILGVIHHPLNGQLLVGMGYETRLNGEKVRVRPCDRIEDALLLTTTHWEVENYHNMAAYEALTRRARSYRTWGDCHGYYLVAIGHADIMLDPIMNLWDVAPLVPIIQGAGGKITNWYGDDVLTGSGAVATGTGIHDAVLAALHR